MLPELLTQTILTKLHTYPKHTPNQKPPRPQPHPKSLVRPSLPLPPSCAAAAAAAVGGLWPAVGGRSPPPPPPRFSWRCADGLAGAAAGSVARRGDMVTPVWTNVVSGGEIGSSSG